MLFAAWFLTRPPSSEEGRLLAFDIGEAFLSSLIELRKFNTLAVTLSTPCCSLVKESDTRASLRAAPTGLPPCLQMGCKRDIVESCG